MTVRIGKYGPYVQIGDAEDEEKPKFASLMKGQLMETITLDEAMELFKLPREVGFYEDKAMVVNIGKYGPYVKHDSKFYSLAPTDDPMAVTEDRLIEIILEKRKTESNRTIREYDENPNVKVLNGKYGPYISFGKRNIKIPRDVEPIKLTYEDVVKLAEGTEEQPAAKAKAKPKAKAKKVKK